ncbi:hypothetical protein BCV02_01215 [Vibrio breoganii]|uniref:Phage protein n=1 Tax=Vibrio breoganii TaxID=553239 RepID=A0ABX1U2P4_9VIBR|nr:hypothetical protein [Vibrio breoganii]NMO72906.1 hypothetical protein [Vibrio breoganii]NMR68743.1 hypothetical protein [Vibrio breoganii]PMG03929.1 hypothetical protein BCV02_01215 [Vibrio breoganii]PML90993.1 hypothetical protein BCT67_03630 [Vibrio breoganii]
MQLDEYIKETLVQITNGVKGASAEIQELGGLVNPQKTKTKVQGSKMNVPQTKQIFVDPEAQLVKFDIALQVKETLGTEAKSGIKLAVLSVGGGVKSSDESYSTQRVQFEVPLVLPSNKPNGE